MSYLPNILFLVIITSGLYVFVKNVLKLKRNIFLGKEISIDETSKPERLKRMFRLAFGQKKLLDRPVSGLLHFIVYVGFIIINLEVLEIIIDGLFGTHRVFSVLGGFYSFLIGSFEILAVLVTISVIIFWIRRNILKIERFFAPEMKSWPKKDANYILYFEVVLMSLFLLMNATDESLNQGNIISSLFHPLFNDFSSYQLMIIERSAWWLHITGILFFLNYLYYSKHLHILLGFPNTYYAKNENLGEFDNLESVTKEVNLMLNPETEVDHDEGEIPSFGAKDIFDLDRVQLLNAYSCTECGRCTSVCPANMTGKKLSPRKIMMDTRDRLEEVGLNIDKNKGDFKIDGKSLLNDYIKKEELWACTSCNACVEECPIGINPLSIILDMRRYLVMEESSAPSELNNMMNNIENNGAPWPFNQMDRLNWADEE